MVVMTNEHFKIKLLNRVITDFKIKSSIEVH